MATLFVVATPIGNLEDMTYRAVRILQETPVVAAEDTRAAKALFHRYGIRPRRLLSFFEGNEAARTEALLEMLGRGENVALISEAGTPGVSDPGQRLVQAAAAAGVRVEVVPGASAVVTALVASGLPTDRFLFVGFLPRAPGKRRELLGSLRGEPATLIFYESPARVAATLADAVAAFGPKRDACLCRELTKLHEEVVRAPLGELAARYEAEAPRGECTLVIAGAAAEEAAADVDIEAEVRALLGQGASPREVAARLAVRTGLPRRRLYQLALALRGDG